MVPSPLPRPPTAVKPPALSSPIALAFAFYAKALADRFLFLHYAVRIARTFNKETGSVDLVFSVPHEDYTNLGPVTREAFDFLVHVGFAVSFVGLAGKLRLKDYWGREIPSAATVSMMETATRPAAVAAPAPAPQPRPAPRPAMAKAPAPAQPARRRVA